MSKLRRKKILEIIASNVVETQEDLQKLLKNEGFDVTQSTVSRDIKQMHLVKALDGEGNYCYVSNYSGSVNNEQKQRFIDIFAKSVESINYAMNDVIIKCYVGTAQGACAAIDSLYSDMVLGTIAGDDTILAVTKTEYDAIKLVKELKSLL